MSPDPVRPARGRRPLVHRGQELRCSWRFEEEARSEGRLRVAGGDEVGRGALCGPVVAGAVILGDGFDPDGLDDSKRLTERQREKLAERIRTRAQAWALGCVEPPEIDRINILRATHLAMRRAVEALSEAPDLLPVERVGGPGPTLVRRAARKGDALGYA